MAASLGQFVEFGPSSVRGQKLTMIARINQQNWFRAPKGVASNDNLPRVSLEVTVAMLQRLATWPFAFFDFFQEFHARLYLDHNKCYWSRIWRLVHRVVVIENGLARKLREVTIVVSYRPSPWPDC